MAGSRKLGPCTASTRPAFCPCVAQFPDRPMNPRKLGRSSPNRLVMVCGPATSPAVQVRCARTALLACTRELSCAWSGPAVPAVSLPLAPAQPTHSAPPTRAPPAGGAGDADGGGRDHAAPHRHRRPRAAGTRHQHCDAGAGGRGCLRIACLPSCWGKRPRPGAALRPLPCSHAPAPCTPGRRRCPPPATAAP